MSLDPLIQANGGIWKVVGATIAGALLIIGFVAKWFGLPWRPKAVVAEKDRNYLAFQEVKELIKDTKTDLKNKIDEAREEANNSHKELAAVVVRQGDDLTEIKYRIGRVAERVSYLEGQGDIHRSTSARTRASD